MLRVNDMRAFEFGTPGGMRERLTDLVIQGRKRATAGLLTAYAAQDEELEHVGERPVVLDNDGRSVATLEITQVDVRAFSQVPWSFVAAEGEGDESVEEWREGHRAEWAAEGVTVDGDTQVVCLHFVLV